MYEYERVVSDLRRVYNADSAERRDHRPKQAWKLQERERFLDLLTRERASTLLEVGAGTGQDSLFFQDHGVRVISTDLSEDMVNRCRAKGLDARVMDFLSLDFPSGSFDAIYAFNCLLHVPDADLDRVLRALRELLRPRGLLYVGVYGSDRDEERIVHDATSLLPRFFAFRTDQRLNEIVANHFEVVSFSVFAVEPKDRFQSAVLRRPEDCVESDRRTRPP
jgi:SAM-dependent methyltransferase